MTNTERSYVEAFKLWMTEWTPHAFATINLPNARTAPREETFYLTCWTRAAENDLLGGRTFKITDFDRRIVWLFRREVSPDELIHYHGIVKFPLNRPWRDERPDFYSLMTRCERLERALRTASSRTPEPFTRKDAHQPNVADIDVRPFDADRNHAGYLLKGMRDFTLPDHRQFTTNDLLRDSGLIVLPHLPKKKRD